MLSLIHRMCGGAVYDAFQPHFPELKNRLPHDPLKAEPVSDVDRLFFADVLAPDFKSDPIPLCPCAGDRRDFLLGEGVQK